MILNDFGMYNFDPCVVYKYTRATYDSFCAPESYETYELGHNSYSVMRSLTASPTATNRILPRPKLVRVKTFSGVYPRRVELVQ